MLQIKNISKKYVTGELVQMALDDVSLNFRDNEFVAVLGPSGSGKTTLLNIIGGLDRYDEGDLIINGISTRDYSDRDWDSYRNHTIGFVFQSYNLIPHQTILSNVEIALTISGVSRAERRERAVAALEQVGLGDQIHKRPNQLSGGQMQRVAIARALINSPDILLADEPTGALDTETSVQVMNLLKEVAKDRMVIMVTHNPDLAMQYATRIVRLQDGRIISDTNPYYVDETALEPAVHQNMGHSSMSLGTSLGLSVNNLMTKRRRTLLTSFAGSIGIIAIALILAVSAGVNNYINALEEDTMAEYPVEVTSSGLDITSMLGTVMGTMEQLTEDAQEDGLRVMTMISRMVNIMDTNELAPFKEYLESGESDIDEYAKAVEYIYDVEPQLYLEDGDTYHQVNPESTLTSGFGLSSTLTSMMSSMMTMMSTFFQLPEKEDLYIDSYEVKAGRWPEAYNECVLVVSSTGSIADYMVYTLGLRDFAEYEDLIDESLNGGVVPEIEYDEIYSYDDIIGTTYKLVSSPDYYEYDSEYDVWTDKRDNEEYMRQLVADGEDITIVGVVMPMEDATTAILTDGINYPASLIEHVAVVAAESEVVQSQLNNPDVNVLTGEEFGEDFSMNLENLFNFDEEIFSEMFDLDEMMDSMAEEMDFSSVDLSSIDMSEAFDFGSMDLSIDLSSIDMSGLMDFSSMDLDMSGMTLDFNIDLSGLDLSLDSLDIDYNEMFAGMDMSSLMNPTAEGITDISAALTEGCESFAIENGMSSYTDLQNDFAGFLGSSEAMELFSDIVNDMVGEAVSGISRSDVTKLVSDLMSADDSEMQAILTEFIIDEMSGMSFSQDLAEQMMRSYEDYAFSDGLTTSESVMGSLTAYLETDEAVGLMTQGMTSMIDMNALDGMVETMIDGVVDEMMGTISLAIQDQLDSQLGAVMDQMSAQLQGEMSSMMSGMMAEIEDQMTSAMSGMMDEIEAQLTEAMSGMTDGLTDVMAAGMEDVMAEVMEQMADSMADAFDMDSEDIMEAFDIDMDEDSLLELMTSMSSAAGSSYAAVLSDLGYVDYSNPSEIDIYPKDFDSKDGVTAIIDDYNLMVDQAGNEELEIAYTDIMGTMMSTVTTIINLVTYVLIAFVSISLVVSSIMIGIITYISVLERTREIGILRALGASKGNVARIFNAETFIVGLVSGIIGVVIALLILIPVNMVVHRFVQDDTVRAFLPVSYGIILIILSVVLTLIGGIIPSRKASKMDPVSALRTE